MQAMLKQAGPLPDALPTRPRVFSGQAARLIVAGAAGTVLFLGTTLYQTYEVNRLRKSTHTSQTPAVLADSARTIPTDTPMAGRTDTPLVAPGTPGPGQQSSPTVIRDTVYIDRYVRVPASVPERVERLTRSGTATDEIPDPRVSLGADRTPAAGVRQVTPDQRLSQAGQPSNEPGKTVTTTGSEAQPPKRSDEPGERLSTTGQPDEARPAQPANDMPATQTGNRPTVAAGQSGSPRPDRAQSVADNAGIRTERSRAGGTLGSNSSRDNATGATDSYATTGSSSAGGTVVPTGTQTESYGPVQQRAAGTDVSRSEANGSALITAEPIQIQPVQVASVAWEQRLMQRSRRMRPARTVVVGGATVTPSGKPDAVAAKPARQSVPSPVKLRVGPGGDLYGKLWSVGGFAELLVGKHLTVSAGLSRASFDNGSYLDEDDFKKVNSNLKEFRRQYPVMGASYRHEILDIRLETVRLIMPITVGYRLPISSSIALTPTLGTNLNLKSQEQGSYIVQQRPMIPPFPPFAGNPATGSPEIGKKDFCETRSVSVFNNLTFGANIDWHKKHWGVQAGPVLSITSQPDPDWVSSLSGGIRARAFFQF